MAQRKRICRECGKSFTAHPKLVKPSQQFYCSNNCKMTAYWKRRIARTAA